MSRDLPPPLPASRAAGAAARRGPDEAADPGAIGARPPRRRGWTATLLVTAGYGLVSLLLADPQRELSYRLGHAVGSMLWPLAGGTVLGALWKRSHASVIGAGVVVGLLLMVEFVQLTLIAQLRRAYVNELQQRIDDWRSTREVWQDRYGDPARQPNARAEVMRATGFVFSFRGDTAQLAGELRDGEPYRERCERLPIGRGALDASWGRICAEVGAAELLVDLQHVREALDAGAVLYAELQRCDGVWRWHDGELVFDAGVGAARRDGIELRLLQLRQKLQACAAPR
ncbi:MAG: hypothetical protein H6835_12620 [Planctomycetes bacterium]|nr:hypothetical protein [Planctomycetota bacterium]